jgi:predicted acetyltransferase
LCIANIGVKADLNFEVCEFYILLFFRRSKSGTEFIHEIESAIAVKWETMQILSAEYATKFWRSFIKAYRGTQYVESEYCDNYWDSVTKQTFEIS